MNLKLFVLIFSIIVLVPIVITASTAVLGMYAKQTLVDKWSERWQVYAGGLGVILHELGHAVTALSFRHRITSLRLINLSKYSVDPSLGSVSHEYNPYSFYQKLGNFFIGIAPFFSCSGFLYLAHHYLVGTRYSFKLQDASLGNGPLDMLETLIKSGSQNINISLRDDMSHPLMALIFLILVFMVSVTGYGISKADWNNVLQGLRQYMEFAAVITIIIISIAQIYNGIDGYIWSIASVLTFLTLNSWLYVLSSMAIIVIIRCLLDQWYPSNFNFRSIKKIFSKGVHHENRTNQFV